VAWGRIVDSSASRQAFPDQRDFEQRYDEARRAFLDEFRAVQGSISEKDLAPANRLYDIAQGRARDGQYESAFQLIQKAFTVLRNIAAQQGNGTNLGGDSLKDMVERQYARLREILAESEKALANAGAEANRGLLEKAYTEAEAAREAIRNAQWRRALTSVSRAMEMARNTVRAARGPDGQIDPETRNRLSSALEVMDRMIREAGDKLTTPDTEVENANALRILEEAQAAAALADRAAQNGHSQEAFRQSHRAIELARICIAVGVRKGPALSDQADKELTNLTLLISRAEDMLGQRDNPTVSQMIEQAGTLRDEALPLIHPEGSNEANLPEATRLIRQATGIISKAIQLAAPVTSREPESVLADFRTRYLARAKEVILTNGPNARAQEMLKRAEDLADQAEEQIKQGQGLAGLSSLRVATELTIQAIRLATAGTQPAN
jgi:hypothetical protein